MIVEFNKKHNLYDNLEKNLYGTKNFKNIHYNFTPVEINNEKYILSSSKNLEGYLMDYKNNIEIKIYLDNNKENNKDIDEKTIECAIMLLKNIIVFGSNNINRQTLLESNCYLDLIANLVLIKFNSSKLDYIVIDNNLDCNIDLNFSNEKKKIKYSWTNENFEQENISKSTNIKNIWLNKYINLPPIPLMIDTIKNCEPITGSAVFDTFNNFLGMVSYINCDEIVITPLIVIKKLYDYLIGNKILYLCLDVVPIKLNFNNALNKIKYKNGLLISNNFYNLILKKKKDLIKKSNDNISNDIVDLENKEKILENLSKYDNILQINNNLKNLKKGYIICDIDNYKIDDKGNIIINESNINSNDENNKLIPLKSYIWLFKNNINNRIILKNISSNNYRGDLTKILINNNEVFSINDSYVKKQINIIKITIQIETNYEDISQIGLSELKYITYNSIKLVELNEKVVEIIKNFIIKNQSKYLNIINYIFDNKYTYSNKKNIIIFNFNKKIPKIKIISREIINFDDLLYKYNSVSKQKKFLLEQFSK